MMMLQQHGQAGVDEQTVELIAARVTAALRDDLELLLATFTQRERSTRSLTVEQLAARLGVARSTVYAHWRESGGYKLGSGPRAPIHFRPDELPAGGDDAWDTRAREARAPSKTSRRERTRRELIKDASRVTQLEELLDGYV
jgi:hypothetical protein